MEINFVISKQYNHFHFVENMSEWSAYARKSENKDWVAATGPFKKAETDALVNACKFFKTYNYGKGVGEYKNVFEFFAVAESPSELESLIGKKDADLLLTPLEVLKPRFEKIWDVQKDNFEAKKQLILDNLYEKEILDDLTKLFGKINVPEEIDIYLVINTAQYASGGANIGDGKITLECSSAVGKNDIHSILWHEIAHLLLYKFAEETYKHIEKKEIRFDFVNEMLAHSVFGVFGVLSDKYYRAPYMLDAQEKMKTYIASGEIAEEDKQFASNLAFRLAQYYTAEYVRERFAKKAMITTQEMAIEIEKIFNETKSARV